MNKVYVEVFGCDIAYINFDFYSLCPKGSIVINCNYEHWKDIYVYEVGHPDFISIKPRIHAVWNYQTTSFDIPWGLVMKSHGVTTTVNQVCSNATVTGSNNWVVNPSKIEPIPCVHREVKEYIGLYERYDYCLKCDHKFK